jgi:hypothetical protein
MNTNHSQTKLEYDLITDGIYIGTNQCCQTHFDESLNQEGITADISLEEERLDAPFGVELYVWIPVKDHAPPSADQLAFGVSALQTLIAKVKKVYVHCKNGHGRAPTIVAAYLITNGMNPEDALALIKSKRPSIHLETSQFEALKTFYGENHST